MTEITDDAIGKNWEMKRRDVLRSAAVMGAVGTFGLPAFSGGVAASSHATETLYLTDSGGDNAGSFLGKLYSVELDDAPTPPRANLTLLHDLTDSDFGQVDAIAASLDGKTVYMVDKTSKHLGTYDVGTGNFADQGAISGLPNGVVLASFSPGGDLFVLSQNDNKMYTVDVSGPTATEYVTISGATVQGADIAFDSDGILYLYSSGAQKLYTVDYDSSSSTFGDATLVGSTGDFFTGLAVRDAGDGDLVGSNTTRDEIVVVDKGTGAQGTKFEMYLGGSRYAYGFGDMTVGELAVCDACETEGALAKYEFACVEEVDGECVAWDFVLEGDGDDGISYTLGSFDSKDDEAFEPITATFETDYCDLAALVKGGRVEEWVEVTVEDGEATVTIDFENSPFENDKNGKLFAISYVEFYCEEPSA